jgi:hypothetical protein
MQVKTILNRVQKHRCFVYGAVRLLEELGEILIEAEIRPRVNSRPTCSGCQLPGPGYDTLAPRRFEFVPLWGIKVFFVYAMRRVDCERCGVVVETVPWVEGKNHLTRTYAWFLAKCQTDELDGGGRGVPHHLGQRVRLGGDGGELGA